MAGLYVNPIQTIEMTRICSLAAFLNVFKRFYTFKNVFN